MAPAQRRNIVVTGAAGGLGRAIARRLAGSGFGLALIDIAPALASVAGELAADGATVAFEVADITDAGAMAGALDRLRQALGALDGLVNNAGITAHIAPLTRMTRDGWQRELDLNLTAPFQLTQAMLPVMVERGWGRIVNISSIGGSGGLYQQAGYAATKSGLLGLTRAVTLEHARHGITCNAILPGLIETDAVSRIPAPIRDDALSLVPARRTGTPDEIGALVTFLCGDDAGFINGAEIAIDGGAHLCQVVLGSMKEIATRRSPAGQAGPQRAGG